VWCIRRTARHALTNELPAALNKKTSATQSARKEFIMAAKKPQHGNISCVADNDIF
jgi:hypothetical protein